MQNIFLHEWETRRGTGVFSPWTCAQQFLNSACRICFSKINLSLPNKGRTILQRMSVWRQLLTVSLVRTLLWNVHTSPLLSDQIARRKFAEGRKNFVLLVFLVLAEIKFFHDQISTFLDFLFFSESEPPPHQKQMDKWKLFWSLVICCVLGHRKRTPSLWDGSRGAVKHTHAVKNVT